MFITHLSHRRYFRISKGLHILCLIEFLYHILACMLKNPYISYGFHNAGKPVKLPPTSFLNDVLDNFCLDCENMNFHIVCIVL